MTTLPYHDNIVILFSPLSQETRSLGKDEESCPTLSLTQLVLALGSLPLTTGINWLLAQRIRFWLLRNWLLALALATGSLSTGKKLLAPSSSWLPSY